ncbi:hypothetical protein JW964_03530 [candidate division KSB1 bacterium]|nr:hypothetical protein [candidate division KSB1 bacterium]
MGLLETIVVVYLRELYYPDGFRFPLALIPPKIISVELLREICTIVMLLSIAMLTETTRYEKFAYFIYSFGVWDIVYYIGLKLLLDWPESLLTWDILFLIPITWLGPMLAPVICSMFMILLALEIVYLQEKKPGFVIKRLEWTLIIAGAVLIFISFIWDYTKMLITTGLFSAYQSLLENEQFKDFITHHIPEFFNWYLFLAGIFAISIAMVWMFRRNFQVIQK